MQKTYIALCAAAALGLCLTAPQGASAFPAADAARKAYTQAVTEKSAATLVHYYRGCHYCRPCYRRYYGGWPFNPPCGSRAALAAAQALRSTSAAARPRSSGFPWCAPPLR
jgi:hypothetical protein